MHSLSDENELNLHVNEISFSFERWAQTLPLRKRLGVIRKWPIESLQCSDDFCFHAGSVVHPRIDIISVTFRVLKTTRSGACIKLSNYKSTKPVSLDFYKTKQSK